MPVIRNIKESQRSDSSVLPSVPTGNHLQVENTRLHDENAMLREQLSMTTKQLLEAMAVLSRAMSYIHRMKISQELQKPQATEKDVSVVADASSSLRDMAKTLTLVEGAEPDQPIHDGTQTTNTKNTLNSPNPPLASTSPDNAILNSSPIELSTKSPQELYTDWLKTFVTPSPATDLLQTDIWAIYKTTFPQFAPGCPLSIASDLFKLLRVTFQDAKTMYVPLTDENPKTQFIIRGLAWNVKEVARASSPDQSAKTLAPVQGNDSESDQPMHDDAQPAITKDTVDGAAAPLPAETTDATAPDCSSGERSTDSSLQPYKDWLQASLIPCAGNDILQTDISAAYRVTFPASSPRRPEWAEDLIKLIPLLFLDAKLMRLNYGDTQKRYVVRGLAWKAK